MRGAIYDSVGNIVSICSVLDQAELQLNVLPGHGALEIPEDIDPRLYYVAEGNLIAKVDMATLSYSPTVTIGGTISVSNVPVGTLVQWPDGVETVESDGVIECVAPFAIPYVFKLFHPTYHIKEVTINGTA